MATERPRTSMRSHRLADPIYLPFKQLAAERGITATDALHEAMAQWMVAQSLANSRRPSKG